MDLTGDTPPPNQAAPGRLSAAVRRRIREAVRRIHRGSAAPAGAFEVAYVLLLSDELDNYLRRLQVELERRYGQNRALSTPPHITLKLGVPTTDLAPFERYLDRIVQEIEPFDVAVQGIDFFDEGIAFLRVEEEPRLEAVRQRIVQDLSETLSIEPYALETGGRYRFHVTLAHGLDPRAFARARVELDRATPRFRFTVETMALLAYTRDFWITYKQMPLAGLARLPGAVR